MCIMHVDACVRGCTYDDTPHPHTQPLRHTPHPRTCGIAGLGVNMPVEAPPLLKFVELGVGVRGD